MGLQRKDRINEANITTRDDRQTQLNTRSVRKTKQGVKRKRWNKWRISITAISIFILLLVGGVGFYFYNMYGRLLTNFDSTVNNDAVDDVSRDSFAVMLLGAGTNGQDGEGAADSITLFVLNPSAHVARIISVPRDSYLPRGASCESAGYFDKIANSGADTTCLKDTLEEVFDLKINYHMLINFVSFVKVVDALGGVEMDVPDLRESFEAWTGSASDGTYLPSSSPKKNGLQWCEHDSSRQPYAVCFDTFGKQQVDGEHALALARSRHYDSDFARSARQSELIRAIANKVANNFNVFLIDQLLSAAEGNIETNIPQSQLFDFATLGKKLMSSASGFSIQPLQLDGASSTFQGDLHHASFNQVSLFSIEHIRYQIAQTFNPNAFPAVNIDAFYYNPGEREENQYASKYQHYDNLGFLKDTMDVQNPSYVKKFNTTNGYMPTASAATNYSLTTNDRKTTRDDE
jgi:anionic cell wall polymer biosynthesis LytR-Cps2A-Psr (LCP) family protein